MSVEPIPRRSTEFCTECLQQVFIHVSGDPFQTTGSPGEGTVILCRSTSIETHSTNNNILPRSMAVVLTDFERHVRSLGVRWRHYLHAQLLLIVVLASIFFFIPGRKYLSRLFSWHLFDLLTRTSLRAVCTSSQEELGWMERARRHGEMLQAGTDSNFASFLAWRVRCRPLVRASLGFGCLQDYYSWWPGYLGCS